jgi:hypothetical protein
LSKSAVPSADEIKPRHIEQEQGIVPARAQSKELAERAAKIVSALFRFHCFNRLGKLWDGTRLPTMKHWQDFSVPLSREKPEAAGFDRLQKTSTGGRRA